MVLWEMLTGEPPFKGLGPLQIGTAVVLGHKRPPIPAAWPPRLVRLLQDCWEGPPARRPDAADVVKQLVLIQRELPCGTA